MNEPRDTLVGDALRRLDVPDHAPGFWDRLDAELADRQPADGHQPDADDVDHHHDADVIDLGSAPGLRRHRSRSPRRQAVAAAAAAAAAAIALTVGLPAVQQAADGDSQVDVADIPDATAPAPPVTPAPETTAPAPPAQQDPEELAVEWLTLLREGEHEAAHSMLDDTSQGALPLDTFLDVATGLAEGAAAFADLPPTVVPLIDDQGLAATAVVFTGDVEREGMIETASYAVVLTGDPADPDRPLAVAFVLDGPMVEDVQRTNPSETRTSPLELEVSPTAGATWAIIDGSAPERIDTGAGTVTLDVEASAGPGTHTVVIVSTEAGRYTARAFTVVVP
jgi:hypothetical protein